MLDVRVRRYVSPLAEQVLDDITPAIEVRNYADEDATITGHVRIYRKSTDSLEYTSELAETELEHGTTATIPALSAWSPGAPADDDYFILADIVATSYLPGPPLPAVLGAFTFDIKPGPMGPAPAGHHATHENGGMDEVDCTGLVGAGGVPAVHDIAGASHSSAATPGRLLKADANGLPVDATNTNAQLVATIGDSHAQNTDTDLEAVFEATFEKVANKGIAGGYCALPNPLDLTLPLRADGTPARPETHFQSQDFTRDSLAIGYFVPPWSLNAVTSGTAGPVAGEANHPGIVFLKSAAGANSGMNIPLDPLAFLLAGGCRADFIVRPQVLAGAVIRCGFGDVKTIADHVDGIYFEMNTVVAVPGTLVGKSASNSVRTTTATSFVLVTNTWYRLHLELNAAANLATFKLYSEAGAVLWTDTVNANLPTGAGRQTGHGLTAFNTAGGTVVICDLDYMDVEIRRTLVR